MDEPDAGTDSAASPAEPGPATGPDNPERDPSVTPPRRRRRWRTVVIGIGVVLIVLVAAAAYYVDSVQLPEELVFPATTRLYYADGPLLTTLGQAKRDPLRYDQIAAPVTQAVVAAEDPTFWTNHGVTFTGVVRAGWNSVTGGRTSSDPTITEEYTRLAYDLVDPSRLRTSVVAWKISDKLSKNQILEGYLNAVPFGRNAYGVEAAAQAYFGKTARNDAPAASQLTVAQAMLLVLQIKQPNPDPNDPAGSPGYDPTVSAKAADQAKIRFDALRQEMVKLGYLRDADQVTFPAAQVKPATPTTGTGASAPVALVVNHVLSELVSAPGPFRGHSWQSIRDGGYNIYTTLDSRAQAAAQAAADPTVTGSPMNGQPTTLGSALVAVEPGTGRVLAYYGGPDGNGADLAGIYRLENGTWSGFGAHPAGSAFEAYTLAAALKSGVALNSYWNWLPHDMPGRTGSARIRNNSACPSDVNGTAGACSLLESTAASLATTFYGVTVSVSPARVLTLARDAGIEHMWSDKGRIDFTATTDMLQQTPQNFDTTLGIGQYPITVADHANGMATFAAGGIRADEHYVMKVLDHDATLFTERSPATNPPPVLNAANSADLTYALSTVSSAKLSNGWPAAGKTGNWESTQDSTSNSQAWMAGYTRKLAAAVWIGGAKGNGPIRDKDNATIWGSGLPAQVWQQFMVTATAALGWTNDAGAAFPPMVGAGNAHPDGSVPAPPGR